MKLNILNNAPNLSIDLGTHVSNVMVTTNTRTKKIKYVSNVLTVMPGGSLLYPPISAKNVPLDTISPKIVHASNAELATNG